MRFCVGNQDYSDLVDWMSYQMDQEEEYKGWVDGYRRTHRNTARTKIKGTLHLGFKDESAYDDFIENLDSSKPDGYSYVPIRAYVANKNTDISFNAYIGVNAKVFKGKVSQRIWADVSLEVEEI